MSKVKFYNQENKKKTKEIENFYANTIFDKIEYIFLM